MKTNKQIRQQQFTLMEILVVCTLLILLMGLTIGGYKIMMYRTSEAASKGIMEQVKTAMEMHKKKYGYYPQQNDGGDLKITENLGKFLPDYEIWIKNETINSDYKLLDAYANSFQYKCPGKHNRGGFDLESAGIDSDLNTPEDNINNW